MNIVGCLYAFFIEKRYLYRWNANFLAEKVPFSGSMLSIRNRPQENAVLYGTNIGEDHTIFDDDGDVSNSTPPAS